MFKANTGSSVQADPKLAGAEAAQKAKEGLDDPKLAYVYASCAYDIDALLEGVAQELPGVPLVGNTSFTGVITPEGLISGDDGFVGIMAVADPDMTVGVAGLEMAEGGCPVELGENVAKAAMESAGKTCPPDYYYMAASPAWEEFIVKGITNVIGRIPFFGGSAADNTISGDWKIYTDKGSFADGVAVTFFYTDKKMTNKFTGAYRETDDRGIITKLNDYRVLAEIDGTPALEQYAEWRDMSVDDLKGGDLLTASITSPLGVKDRLGDLIAIRHPMNGNDDLSMNLGNQLAEGTAVIRMEATVDELVDSTGMTLNALKAKMEVPAGAYHLVHCGGRMAGIGDRVDEVVDQIKTAAGDVPFIVEFTFGEYGTEQDGLNTCGGLMLSFTGFEA